MPRLRLALGRRTFVLLATAFICTCLYLASQYKDAAPYLDSILGASQSHLGFDNSFSHLDGLMSSDQASEILRAPVPNVDPSQYVDTLIGTLKGGNVFAGPSTPFGSVKPGLDSIVGNNQAGFVPDGVSPIRGVSALHDDGTGGYPSLGMSSLLPQYCQLANNEAASECKWATDGRATNISFESVSSSPGRFSFKLQNGIGIQFSSTDRAAMYTFDYSPVLRQPSVPVYPGSPSRPEVAADPPSVVQEKRAILLFDHISDLRYSGGRNVNNTLTTSNFTLPPPAGSASAVPVTRVETSALFLPSFGVGNFTVYSCLDVPYASSFDIYLRRDLKPKMTSIEGIQVAGGIVLTVDRDTLKGATLNGVLPVRMGISWTSTAAACKYAESELPNFHVKGNFDSVVQQSRSKWNHLLGDTLWISQEGVTHADLTLFYSSLYRSFLSPNNVTGDNPRFQTTKPSYDSLYCIWDSARTVHPLWVLLAPKVQAEVLQAVVEIQKHEGWLPDCRMSTDQGWTQGGSNAEMMLSDSYVKGILANDTAFWEDALQAMLKDAQDEPVSWGQVGRGGIAARAKLGYVPTGPSGGALVLGSVPGRSASRTVEYAFNDFSIALVAAGLRRRELYDTYRRLTDDTFNLWNPDIVSDGFSGFLQPRDENGTWVYQDPKRCSSALEPLSCFLNIGGGEFYEASAWQYSYFAPQDAAKLVELMGGHKRFVQRYDHMWKNEYADIGNEPAFLALYSANFAIGGYSHTVDQVVSIIRSKFDTTKTGLPGNDDIGAMGSFVVWSHFGFYPVAGTGVYLLSTPLLSAFAITNQMTGKIFRLTTRGFDGAKKNKYIVEARLDGKPYTKTWLCHSVFAEGATLELTLGPKPSRTFGMKEDDLPPSLSTGGYRYDSSYLGC
ncbi:Glycosyl hydrolase family 92 [Kalmanozyma brasiliensis GHG001]|uniref:Alpha-1,2-mannosidase n=1 Tax=Kalmanozyma brasiliensis (strain GHG001) TaxID=1365824 RepID=V5EQC8_KALBG|nr:Glycosyl hydrolase family 92 [Kalmanozyma brasiliensis GHG001]EST07345.1 Glycosyl hydrolase family 92 [Kalmanozyma brasiliensis GHG001]